MDSAKDQKHPLVQINAKQTNTVLNKKPTECFHLLRALRRLPKNSNLNQSQYIKSSNKTRTVASNLPHKKQATLVHYLIIFFRKIFCLRFYKPGLKLTELVQRDDQLLPCLLFVVTKIFRVANRLKSTGMENRLEAITIRFANLLEQSEKV